MVVDDEPVAREAIERELRSRYGADYEIVAETTAETAMARLRRLRDQRADVVLVLADQWMPAVTGAQLLASVRALHPLARRVLLIELGDRSCIGPIRQAAALGHLDHHVAKPMITPDERFHRAIAELLDEWWRLRGEWFDVVRVVDEPRSARAAELRDLLSRNGVTFRFVPSDSDEGRALLAEAGRGGPRLPMLVLYDGRVLSDPTHTEVAEALGVQVLPGDETFDLAVVGAGPAGLAASVYATSEGLRTVLIEHHALGGQAGTSSLIRNYLGFPRGISGAELAMRAFEQAWVFGAELVYGSPATALRADGNLRIVGLSHGSDISARAVVIATGVSYRRLEIPALEALLGAGVFYGAAVTEAQGLAGQRVFVVGGGNSAGQAALHLAAYAERVTILVRSGSLASSMSDYLVTQIRSAPTIEVRFDAEVVGGGGNGHLEHLEVRDSRTGAVEDVPAGALFVLIGALPRTDWLAATTARDRWGYILTDADVTAAGVWHVARPPFRFETAMPGVFAVGDVRHGSLKRVASAVGEGSVCVPAVHEYLALAGVGAAP
jgi:thioredoxin reductase (NADPH)